MPGKQYHSSLRDILISAGNAILSVYNQAGELEVQSKEDNSPLTLADQLAHKVIVDGLAKLDPEIPVLSEESALPEFSERQRWQRYWLVDPLDGTKEFIGRNGEFTVNIALVEQGKPLAGWVYVPVKAELYYGWSGSEKAAFKEVNGKVTPISSRPLNTGDAMYVVASRRHGGDNLLILLEKARKVFASIELKNFGSSLKICMVAEGSADWYPRLAPTSEWDTAAAHAVLLGAGGVILDERMNSLAYNQKECILNPHFHVLGNDNEVWRNLLEAS